MSRLRLLLPLLLVALLSGCVSLPSGGTVHAGPEQDSTEEDAPFYFTPGGPERGDTPFEIVQGFLLAMQATPLTTAVAREFLTDQSNSRWVPERSTVVYDTRAPLTARGSTVTVSFDGVTRLDARGAWLGSEGRPEQTVALRLVREGGQWRIANPPDALIIPRTHFDTRYQQSFLYFFDKTAQILVPEPVYVPRGEQAPTLLVRGLLRGPARELLGTERTFVPAGTELDLSVPVTRDGVAEVPLSDQVLDLDDEQLQKLLAQLGWTLRQVPGIERMRVTVDGSPLEVGGGESTAGLLEGWSQYDPAVNWASQELFGIRDGRVVTLLRGEERRISGLFGSQDYALRSIAVDLAAEQVAGVSADGTSVVVAPRARQAGQVPAADEAVTVYSGGTDVLRPAWDFYGQLWLVDRTRRGAEVSVVRAGVATRVDVPGITGAAVRAFVVSRDGTRLVAVVRGEDGDSLVLARTIRDDEGRVRGFTEGRRLPVGNLPVREIRDLAWRTPGTLALLTGPTPGLSQLVVVRIDGSSAVGDLATNTELFRDEAARVVTTPLPGVPLYVGTTTGRLFELAANGRWTGSSVRDGLVSPTFPG